MTTNFRFRTVAKSVVTVVVVWTGAVALVGCASSETSPSGHHARTRTKVQYDSNQLLMKSADQMSEMVRKKIKYAQDIQSQQKVDVDVGIQTEPEAVAALEDALRITLSRPDQDGSRANLFSRLRRELTDLNSFDDVLKSLASESIAALKDSGTPLRFQSTYIVLLENLMAELKPEVQTQPVFKQVIEQIRDADIEISDRLASRAMLRSMSRPVSPSVTAAQILPKPKD